MLFPNILQGVILPLHHFSQLHMDHPPGTLLCQRGNTYVILIDFAKFPSKGVVPFCTFISKYECLFPHSLINRRYIVSVWIFANLTGIVLICILLKCELIMLSCLRTIYIFLWTVLFLFFSLVIGCLFLNFCELFIFLEGYSSSCYELNIFFRLGIILISLDSLSYHPPCTHSHITQSPVFKDSDCGLGTKSGTFCIGTTTLAFFQDFKLMATDTCST